MTPKHTPGPPAVKCSCGAIYIATPDGDGDGWILTCPLHAAAPDLLAALRDAIAPFAGWDESALKAYPHKIGPAVVRARAVIAKAEGN